MQGLIATITDLPQPTVWRLCLIIERCTPQTMLILRQACKDTFRHEN
jgi:hypothetical protein